MQVRCCCDANKVLGYLPDPLPGERKKVFRTRDGREVEFEVGRIVTPLEACLDMDGRLAYKSKDYPEELLHSIPQFTGV